MKIERTDLPGVMIFTPDVYEDERGAVKETLNKYMNFYPVQVNQAINNKGTIRGLHNQLGVGKLVWVVRGAIYDVAYDAKTGNQVSINLTADNHKQIYLPGDYYHGFQALLDGTIVCYLLDGYYNPKTEDGLNPDLVKWPLDKMILSEKDRNAKRSFHAHKLPR